ncbi:snaclec 4-like [Gigantopelta aegis]|uniref:snaclec 4-like n=1 Tax=Gigantopelta aegis TaxID=1735272 RepID=UPI001B8883DD|nr:snaclec 4-like [Gigantopelta aegis]
MLEFRIGFVALLTFVCSRSLAGEELQYTTLGQLAFGCPQGWKSFETNCYFLADFNMEFEDAEKTCENLGTMSLKIDDDIENKKVAEFARNVSWTRFWNGHKYSESVSQHYNFCTLFYENKTRYVRPEEDTSLAVIVHQAKAVGML